MSEERSERFGDKAPLSRRSRPVHREDADLVAGIVRQIRALGERLAAGDPDGVDLLRRLDRELQTAWRVAVAGWRRAGFSDSDIGEALGMTKQAVQQRWPRASTSSTAAPRPARMPTDCR